MDLQMSNALSQRQTKHNHCDAEYKIARSLDKGYRLRNRRIAQSVLTFFVFLGLYWIVGYYTNHIGFLSNTSAFLVDKALIVRSTLRLESAGFSYPPFALFIAFLMPKPLLLTLFGGLVSAILGTMVIRDLFSTQLQRRLVFILMVTMFGTPMMIFLTTQELSSALCILLIYLSFRAFHNYRRQGSVHAIFQSGLWLGLAFFTTPITIYFAVGLGIFVLVENHVHRLWGRIAAFMVLLFPIAASLSSWAYLSWLFTGKIALAYPSQLTFHWTPEQIVMVAFVPATIVTTLVLSRQMQSLLILIPIFLMVVSPSIGLSNFVAFNVLLTLLTLSTIPNRFSQGYKNLIGVAALLQFIASYVIPTHSGELGPFRSIVQNSNLSPQMALERQVSSHLRSAPAQSILTDDRMTYRIVAYTGTNRPFVLPTNPNFTEMASDPASFVNYVLVLGTAETANSPLRAYSQTAPPGMVLDMKFDGYVLYRKSDEPPLV